MTKICQTPGCGKPASLQCPTCIKLNILQSHFCGQDCFKGYFNEHKVLHKLARTQIGDGGDSKNVVKPLFPDYHYTGPLRAYPQSPRRTVPPLIERPDYATREDGVSLAEREAKKSSQIKVLTDEEQESMRVVCRLARECLDVAAEAAKAGVTTDEIDMLVHEAAVERDCYPSPLNYFGFPKSCCTSVNEVICHGIPDLRPLENGDLLNVDITVYHRGFHGDLNETFFIGEVDQKYKDLVKVTHESLMLAIDAVKPGLKYREIGNIIQKHVSQHGYSVVRTYCGHGIHRLFHTCPNVPHYAKNKAVGVIQEGHCFTIEPMINEGGPGDDQWPDNWTAVTRDGKRSAQFEHTLLVHGTGCDILTQRREKNGQPWFLDNL